MKITARLTTVIVVTVLSPLLPISAVIAAGPVTIRLDPGGAGVRFTMSRTASTDSFAEVGPPYRRVHLHICGLAIGALRGAAVSGSPQKFWTCCTCFGSSSN